MQAAMTAGSALQRAHDEAAANDTCWPSGWRFSESIGNTIELYGQCFFGCRFVYCEVIFRGLKPYGYDANPFVRCRFVLMDRARMVFTHLAEMLDDDTFARLAAGHRGRRIVPN